MDDGRWTKDDGQRTLEKSGESPARRGQSVCMRAERAEFSTLSIVHLTLYFPAIFHLPRSLLQTS